MGSKPTHVPTEQTRTLVRRLAGLGVTVNDVARLNNISDVTVLKYYREDLEHGRAEANMAVSRSLFKAATREHNPNVVACMFWLKNRAGWKALVSTDTKPGELGGINVLRVEFVEAQPKPAPAPTKAPTINAESFEISFDAKEQPP